MDIAAVLFGICTCRKKGGESSLLSWGMLIQFRCLFYFIHDLYFELMGSKAFGARHASTERRHYEIAI